MCQTRNVRRGCNNTTKTHQPISIHHLPYTVVGKPVSWIMLSMMDYREWVGFYTSRLFPDWCSYKSYALLFASLSNCLCTYGEMPRDHKCNNWNETSAVYSSKGALLLIFQLQIWRVQTLESVHNSFIELVHVSWAVSQNWNYARLTNTEISEIPGMLGKFCACANSVYQATS